MLDEEDTKRRTSRVPPGKPSRTTVGKRCFRTLMFGARFSGTNVTKVIRLDCFGGVGGGKERERSSGITHAPHQGLDNCSATYMTSFETFILNVHQALEIPLHTFRDLYMHTRRDAK